MVGGQNGDCECSDGYTGTPPNCLGGCDPSCVTCNGTTENDCLSCFTNASVQNDGSCQCNDGYYDPDDNGGGHSSTCDQCYTPECSASSSNVPTCTNPEVTITEG